MNTILISETHLNFCVAMILKFLKTDPKAIFSSKCTKKKNFFQFFPADNNFVRSKKTFVRRIILLEAKKHEFHLQNPLNKVIEQEY